MPFSFHHHLAPFLLFCSRSALCSIDWWLKVWTGVWGGVRLEFLANNERKASYILVLAQTLFHPQRAPTLFHRSSCHTSIMHASHLQPKRCHGKSVVPTQRRCGRRGPYDCMCISCQRPRLLAVAGDARAAAPGRTAGSAFGVGSIGTT